MSVVFRRAIWSWIESFPREFDEMSNSGRRMEGGVETLFDVIYILSESSDRRKAFAYPLLSMLLTLMPDILEKLEGGGRSAGIIKKLQFFENLRKALKGSKLSEIAATCFVDLIAAAASTNDLDTPLRLLVSDIDSDLKVRCFTALIAVVDFFSSSEQASRSNSNVSQSRWTSESQINDRCLGCAIQARSNAHLSFSAICTQQSSIRNVPIGWFEWNSCSRRG